MESRQPDTIVLTSVDTLKAGLSDAGRAGNPRIIDDRERTPNDNSEESTKEAQDGTIGGENDRRD